MLNEMFHRLRLVRELLFIAILTTKFLTLVFDFVIKVITGVGLFYYGNGSTRRKMGASV